MRGNSRKASDYKAVAWGLILAVRYRAALPVAGYD
jgi:hypothetical protein